MYFFVYFCDERHSIRVKWLKFLSLTLFFFYFHLSPQNDRLNANRKKPHDIQIQILLTLALALSLHDIIKCRWNQKNKSSFHINHASSTHTNHIQIEIHKKIKVNRNFFKITLECLSISFINFCVLREVRNAPRGTQYRVIKNNRYLKLWREIFWWKLEWNLCYLQFMQQTAIEWGELEWKNKLCNCFLVFFWSSFQKSLLHP